MQLIIFCGIQATGKSTYYKQHFFNSHVRISMDLLNTRNREAKFFELALQTRAKIVIDNTNPLKSERAKYIDLAQLYHYKIICYHFTSPLSDSLARNRNRLGKEKIKEVGIRATFNKFEEPSFDEGFHEIYKVQLVKNQFIIEQIHQPIF